MNEYNMKEIMNEKSKQILSFQHIVQYYLYISVEYLPTQVALETFDLYNLTKNPKSSLTGQEMIEIALSMFQKAASLPVSDDGTDINGMLLGGASINVNRAVELSVSWIQDVYDL